jgi:hypothetical protein
VIDEHRPRTIELDVVCRRIRQGEAGLQQIEVRIEMEQRRILVQAEAPFVGIGNEGHARMFQHVRRSNAGQGVLGNRRVVNQLAGIGHAAQNTGLLGQLERRCRARHHCPQDAFVAQIHAATGIAERSRLNPGQSTHSWSAPALLLRAKKLFTL